MARGGARKAFMQKLGAALMIAALGASSVAMADDHHWGDRDDRYGHWHDRDRYDRYDRDDYNNVPRDAWQQLARFEFHDRNAMIDLGNARVRTIELQAILGSMDVRGIKVFYADRTSQWIPVHRQVDVQHAPNLRFDVARGDIGVSGIYVVGRGHAGFNVIGGR